MIITELILAFSSSSSSSSSSNGSSASFNLLFSNFAFKIKHSRFKIFRFFFCVCYPLDLLTFFLSISSGDVVMGFGRIGAERPFALSADRGQVIDQSSLACMFCFPN